MSLFYIMFLLTAHMDIGVRSGARGRRPSHRKGAQNNAIIYAVIILYYVLAYSPHGYRGALGRARPKAEP